LPYLDSIDYVLVADGAGLLAAQVPAGARIDLLDQLHRPPRPTSRLLFDGKAKGDYGF